MTVSYDNSKILYEGIKAAGTRSVSALSETWLGLLLQRAEHDPEMSLVQVAKEEEAIGRACTVFCVNGLVVKRVSVLRRRWTDG